MRHSKKKLSGKRIVPKFYIIGGKKDEKETIDRCRCRIGFVHQHLANGICVSMETKLNRIREAILQGLKGFEENLDNHVRNELFRYNCILVESDR